MEIDMTLSGPINIDFGVEELDNVLPLSIEGSIGGGTRDYNKLIHKPSINGTELIGNYDEIDPTVPDWAKEENKPAYTAEEIGAVNADSEMSFADIKAVWDSFFV